MTEPIQIDIGNMMAASAGEHGLTPEMLQEAMPAAAMLCTVSLKNLRRVTPARLTKASSFMDDSWRFYHDLGASIICCC